MRNLKRVLSLALATVMLLGMMVIGAGAADAKAEAPKATAITDLDKVVNKEAVNLMVDLGIIVGKPDGTFAPTETVDRATMAKLITYIVMGDVDAGLFEGTTTDLKDIETSWAKGYIKYCYANKIIGGDGQGSFFPTKGVTAAEAAKMLLVALGYDAKAQGYEGSSWNINVMRDAKIAGLLEGVSAKTNDPLTRDNAAKMIFNALNALTVTYETQYDGGVAYKTNPSTKPGGVLNPTLGNVSYTLSAPIVGALTANEFTTTMTKGYSVIGLNTVRVATVLADMGKNVSYYTFMKDGKTAYSSVATVSSKVKTVAIPHTLAASPVGAGEKLVSTWLSENGLTISTATNYTENYANYVKGTAHVGVAAVTAALEGVTADQTAYVIDNNADGVIDATVINAQVVDFVTGELKTTTSGTVTSVYVPGVTTGYFNVNNVIGYKDLKKGDVVITMTVGTTTYIEKAASFTGTINGYNANKNTVTIDGTVYTVSTMNGGFKSYQKYIDLGYTQTCTFYKDANGKLVYATAPEAAKANFGVVLGFQKSVLSSTSGQAMLLKVDGSTETVTVASASTAALGGADDTLDSDKFVYVSYSVNDAGEYVFTAPKNATVSAKLSSRYITRGSANYIMCSGSATGTGGYGGNADTVFLVANRNTAGKITGYSSFVGIANAPAYGGTATGYVISDANKIAKLVVITAGTEVYAGTGSFFYAQHVNNANYDSTAKTYSVEGFLNGVKQSVVIKSGVYSTLADNTLYAVTVVDNVVTGATSQAYTAENLKGIKYTGGTIIIGTSEATPLYLNLVEEPTIFLLDSSTTTLTSLNADSIQADTNDTVSYLLNGAGKVSVVFITKVANTVSGFAGIGALIDATDSKLTGTAQTTAALATTISNISTAISADWIGDADLGTTGVTSIDGNYLGFTIKTAASHAYDMTITVVGTKTSPANWVPTAATTISIPHGGAAATATGSYKMATGTDGLQITVTLTDGDLITSQVYTLDITAS